MRTTIILAAFLLGATAAHAQYYGSGSNYGIGSNPNSHSVSGYTRSNGTYVQPYQASNPNNTQRDNYGTSGNYNPYSESYGHRTPRY